MVIVHRDHGIYGLDETVQTYKKILQGFYHSKFEKTLKSNNIPYIITDYEDYDEDLVGDYSCSEDNVELCEEGDCEIWPFTQGDNQVTIYREDYSDEYTDYKDECTATETFIIQKNNN